jgi:hypothetical protein
MRLHWSGPHTEGMLCSLHFFNKGFHYIIEEFKRMLIPQNLETHRILNLAFAAFMVCEAAMNENNFIKIPQYSNLLPTNTGVDIYEDTGIDHIECAIRCLTLRHACIGIFYNTFLESCKPLTSSQSGVLVYVNQTGWNFWSKGKFYYCDITF